ncbi:fibronectin-like isoform X2 [Amblyomma americanum]
MSPSGDRHRQGTSLLVACFLGTLCISANAKVSTRHSEKLDLPLHVATSDLIDPPTNFIASVFCNNTLAASWEYGVEKLFNIDGFFVTLCHKDGSKCYNSTIHLPYMGFTFQILEYSTSYQAKVFAFFNNGPYKTYSKPAQVAFASYPKIPQLQRLSVTAISPTELKAQWNTKWNDNIVFTICSDETSCKKEIVHGRDSEHTFSGLKPSTSYVVSAQPAATVNNKTCKGDIQKRSATTLSIAPPTNLTVAVSCDGNFDATWLYKAQDDIDGFITQLCYKNGSGCRNKTVNASSRKVTYVVTEPNTTFTISVRAYVDDGSTSDADQVTFTSFPDLPNLEDLSVNAISPTEVQATWREKWSYDIEFAICSEPTQCKTPKVPGLLLNYTFTDLEPDTKYTVSAQAEFSAQNKTCKGHKQERVASTFELDPPRNLTVDVLCTNEANVKWMYDNKKWLTGFVARLCYESDPQICKNKTIPYTELYCTFPLPDFNAKYNITVWAYYKDHESKKKSFSEPAGTNFTSYPKLPRLGGLTVTGVSTTELLVSWQDKWAGDIYFTLCSSPAECRNETAEGTEHKRTFDGLHPNTTYTVSVKTGATLSNRTCFGPVQEATASTFVKPPGKVQNLKGDIINGTLLEASWDAPEEDEQPSGYTVQCYDSETHYNESEDIIGSKKSNQVSFTLHELRATFNCSVRAFNTNTTGRYVYGPPESFDVTTDGIDAPKDVTLVASTATSFTFRWLADPNATKCEVDVRREDLYGESLVRIEACGESVNGTVTHNVTDLDPWTAYNVSMKNCRDTFCGEPSFAVSTTEVAAPSEVRNFSYAIEKDVKVHFTWEAPEHPNGPLDGYCLRIYDEDKHETRMIVFAAIVTNITVDLKFEFHLFNVSIAAYNIDNTTKAPLYSSESELGFETFGKGPMPPRPKAEDVEENRVQLYWEEPEDPRFNITGFEVKVTGQTPFETTARNVTIEHLSAWTNYEVNVSSCTNKSDCGQDRHFAFRTDFGEPSEPQDFKAPSAGTHWMLVQWEKPKVLNGPLSGYNLTFSQGASRTHALTTELSYNATNLVPGTNYEVSVYAFNEVQSVIKHGPAVTLQASTQADTPSTAGASTATIVLAVLIPLIFLLLIAAFFLYKRYQKRTGERTPLTSAEDS